MPGPAPARTPAKQSPAAPAAIHAGRRTNPAAQAYRARIRTRYAELYDERTRTETALAAAETAAASADDPDLLDAGDILTAAPDRVKEAICAAFDTHVLYRKELHQVIIWATITPATPGIIQALIDDPRTDDDTCPDIPAPAATLERSQRHIDCGGVPAG